VFKLLLAHGWNAWGVITQIASELGVHKSTITRDRQQIERAMLGR
jgi:IS30 family transposase